MYFKKSNLEIGNFLQGTMPENLKITIYSRSMAILFMILTKKF